MWSFQRTDPEGPFVACPAGFRCTLKSVRFESLADFEATLSQRKLAIWVVGCLSSSQLFCARSDWTSLRWSSKQCDLAAWWVDECMVVEFFGCSPCIFVYDVGFLLRRVSGDFFSLDKVVAYQALIHICSVGAQDVGFLDYFALWFIFVSEVSFALISSSRFLRRAFLPRWLDGMSDDVKVNIAHFVSVVGRTVISSHVGPQTDGFEKTRGGIFEECFSRISLCFGN